MQGNNAQYVSIVAPQAEQLVLARLRKDFNPYVQIIPDLQPAIDFCNIIQHHRITSLPWIRPPGPVDPELSGYFLSNATIPRQWDLRATFPWPSGKKVRGLVAWVSHKKGIAY